MVGQNRIIWATITQKQTAFNAWALTSGIAFSQWNCGQAPVAAGLIEHANNNLSVYPNPAISEIVINGLLPTNNKKVFIYNILGNLEREIILYGKENERVNVADLMPGCYFLKIDKRNFKFIKE